MIRFPSDFMWGAATSAYQVEGGNVHSDWWQWEKEAGKEQSGAACRHYELYEQDFDLAKGLHHNAHRFSVEWARVEPEEGKFSEEAIQHYVNVALALKARGLEPIVTLHHFTNPIWFSKEGGWEKRRSVAQFLRFSDRMVRALAKHVRFWITINEPTIIISHAYILGVWPPQGRSVLRAKIVEDHMAHAHIKAYRLIHGIYREMGLLKPAVSISQHVQAMVPCVPNLVNRFAAWLRNQWYNFGLLDRFARTKTLDFIGINYYSRQLVELKQWGLVNLASDVCGNGHFPAKKNSLGWDIYPEGLHAMMLKLKKYNLPIMITENGICTLDDRERWEFLAAHLTQIHLAMEQGVKVMGYLYWSLMDNFEWDKGFGPRFGLIDIDYKTGKRTVRESAVKYSEVCQTGVLK